MRRQTVLLTIAAVALALAFGLVPAQAGTLVLGGAYSAISMTIDGGPATWEGGGSIDPSLLDGVSLDWVYCVDLFTRVGVPSTYNNTGVTDTGIVNGAPVHNAGKVAWLLGEYGVAGQGVQAKALQAAIWETIYDGTGPGGHTAALSSSAPQDLKDLKNSMLTALGNNSGVVSDFLWLSPAKTNNSIVYQGLVAHVWTPQTVPDGGLTLMLLGGALMGLEALRRRTRG